MADAWFDTTPEQDLPWEGVMPGPDLAAALAVIDPHTLEVEACMSYAKACDQLSSWSQAQVGLALAAAREPVLRATGGITVDGHVSSRGESWAWDEFAALLHLAPMTAATRVHRGKAMWHDHPRIGRAVQAGELTWAQGCALVDAMQSIETSPTNDDIDVEAAHARMMSTALDQMLTTAGRYAPGRLKTRMLAAIIRIEPTAHKKLHQRSVKRQTGIEVWGLSHGMATLGITGVAVDIDALKSLIHSHAQDLRFKHDELVNTPHTPIDPDSADERTVGQWRRAAMLEVFGLAPIGMPASPVDPARVDGSRAIANIDVKVVVDLPTILGLVHTPGEIPGYGPIDPELATFLAANGEWTRWITEPVTGQLLDDGDRRFPTAGLARFIRARDMRCAAPACGRNTNLDIDHIPTWAATHTTNAQQLTLSCIRHNRSRDAHGWNTPAPHTWTTPTGRTYTTVPHQALPRSDNPDSASDDEPIPF